LKNLQINIFTHELIWMGQIDNVKSLVHRSSWHEIPNSELTVSKTAQGVEELQIGRILVVNNQRDKALIIEDVSASLDDQHLTFTCIPLKGMLNYRIVHPNDSGGVGNAPWVGRYQSQVMTWMVSDNLITQTRDNDRKFWNDARTVNLLRVAPVKTIGDTIDFAVDWNTGLMGDTITSIAKMYGVTQKTPLGWNIYITEDYKAFEMDVYLGREKHIDQTILPPVVFSEEFGNLKNATYQYSIKDWRNVAYMQWNNGTTDQNTPVGEKTHGDTISFLRKEIIINSSKKTSTEVQSEGRSELNKRPHIESFQAEIINNNRTMSTYNEDWILGDIITVQSKQVLKDNLISLNAQITQIEETYDSGEYTINATFGESKLTLIQLIKQSIEQKK
jgi:hypothetical protein